MILGGSSFYVGYNFGIYSYVSFALKDTMCATIASGVSFGLATGAISGFGLNLIEGKSILSSFLSGVVFSVKNSIYDSISFSTGINLNLWDKNAILSK